MLGDIEDVKHQIALIIAGAAFTAQLATIDAEKDDGITTPAPAQVEECEKANFTNYPACRVIGLGAEYDQDSNAAKDGRHLVSVDFLQTGDDEATVTKQVERLVRAARDVLWESLLGEGINAAPTIVTREDYGQLAVNENNAFLKGGGLIVQVSTVVD